MTILKKLNMADNLDFYRWIISKIITYQGNFEINKKKLQ